MKLIICKQVLFLILFATAYSMAVDDTNDQYENIPIDETLSVIQDSSANKNVSNVQDVPKAQVSSTNQEISTRPTSSIANVDFTPVSSKKIKMMEQSLLLILAIKAMPNTLRLRREMTLTRLRKETRLVDILLHLDVL